MVVRPVAVAARLCLAAAALPSLSSYGYPAAISIHSPYIHANDRQALGSKSDAASKALVLSM